MTHPTHWTTAPRESRSSRPIEPVKRKDTLPRVILQWACVLAAVAAASQLVGCAPALSDTLVDSMVAQDKREAENQPVITEAVLVEIDMLLAKTQGPRPPDISPEDWEAVQRSVRVLVNLENEQ